MPPKKSATKAIVGEYDIKVMNAEELEMYIEALIDEHERMRKCRNLYHKDKYELLNFLKCIQEKTIDRKQVGIQKNFELQQVIHDSKQELNLNDQLNRMKELEHIEEAERDRLESFVRVKIAEILHKEDEYALMKDITERDREIQDLEYTYKLMVVELQENKLSAWSELSSNKEITFNNRLIEYNKTYHKTFETYSQNKIDTFRATIEGIVNINHNAFLEFVVNIGEYYKDIYWKNIMTTRDLLNTLTKLKKQLNALTLNLRDVLNQNEELTIFITDISLSDLEQSSPIFSQNKMQTADELTYENYVLTVKLDMLNREYNDLKAKFASAVRSVYQKADYRALHLERKLLSIDNAEVNDTDTL